MISTSLFLEYAIYIARLTYDIVNAKLAQGLTKGRYSVRPTVISSDASSLSGIRRVEGTWHGPPVMPRVRVSIRSTQDKHIA